MRTIHPMWTRLLCLIAFSTACGQPDQRQAVVRQYAVNLYANFKDSIADVQALQQAVDSFIAAPSADGLAAAKQAWTNSRGHYGETEIDRFYRGPIDELQGRINEWPIDENYIDYTAGNPDNGIINRTQDVPQITAQVLSYYDGVAGAGNLALGYHAVEFLLWGQRPDQTQGPGTRPYTDFVDSGTAQNQGRRRTYLKIATDLLLGDLKEVYAQWDLSDPMSYAAQMVAGPPQDALANILRGQGNMAIAELLYERLSDPFVTRGEKDEESCFSESTYDDLVANMLGVENVYLGRYHAQQGPGVTDLVAAKDPMLDMQVRQQLTAAKAAIAAIPQPFDHSVLAADGTPQRAAVQAAITAMMPLISSLNAVAQAVGVTINL